MKCIHIFQAGKHTAMSGQTISFSDADVAGIAAAYDPALHEAPLVIGHPSHDAPAYGWVGGLKADQAGLFAEPRQVDGQLAEMVKAGKFKKVSASFYTPDATNNPAPGSYYLRHVGFLGAQPPAVKGLAPIELGDDAQCVTVEFGDFSARTVTGLFRRMRDFMIEQFGAEAADKALPVHEIDWLRDQAEMDAKPAAFAKTAAHTTHTPVDPNPEKDMSKDEIAAREKALADKEAAFAEREKATAERDKTARRADNKAFIDGLVTSAQLPQGLSALTLDLMEHLDAGTTVSFGEGDGKFDGTAQAAFRKLLAALPKSVDFGERAKGALPGEGSVSFAAPAGVVIDQDRAALHAKALAFQEANPGTDYLTAVRKVERAA